MRHQKKRHLLSRPNDQRRALIRNLTTQVLQHGSVQTTEAKAKAVRSHVEKMITLAKRGDLSARRQVSSFLLENRSSKPMVLKGKDAENIDETQYRVVEQGKKKAKVRQKTVAQRLFESIAPKYADRNGGYTRILKLPPRRGDGAPMAIIELV